MKAQMFMEIILGLSVMALLFVGTIVMLNFFILDSPLIFSNEKDSLLESFQLHVTLVEQSNNNIETKFTFPDIIADEDYNLSFKEGYNRSLIIFNFSSGIKMVEVPGLINLSPVNTTGVYIISKNNNKIYISKAP